METQRPTSVELDGAPATKFVLLSIVVAPFAPSGRPTKAAAPPSVPVKLMTARRCAKPPRMQRADRTTKRGASGSALVNATPSNWANGSGWALMRSKSDMPLLLEAELKLGSGMEEPAGPRALEKAIPCGRIVPTAAGALKRQRQNGPQLAMSNNCAKERPPKSGAVSGVRRYWP